MHQEEQVMFGRQAQGYQTVLLLIQQLALLLKQRMWLQAQMLIAVLIQIQ